VFTARSGLIPYIKQINFRLLKVKLFPSQTLSRMDTPTILKLVIIYLLAYKDGTDRVF